MEVGVGGGAGDARLVCGSGLFAGAILWEGGDGVSGGELGGGSAMKAGDWVRHLLEAKLDQGFVVAVTETKFGTRVRVQFLANRKQHNYNPKYLEVISK